ncbi:MAG: hypothetical protein QNJ46_25915 [Leptolyngbyaceae cyanobacterium MO_188.B28]|nr:hypothetical protein [Leptolyngbyaceae cyanobacterium MO_188.B28]
MLDNTAQPNDKSGQKPVNSNVVPDPWQEDLSPQPQSIRPSQQVSLDPGREIAAAPAPEGVLSPEGKPSALQIPPHTTPTPTEVLLQEELKVSATQAKSLWDHIRDLLALWWWRGPQDEQPT